MSRRAGGLFPVDLTVKGSDILGEGCWLFHRGEMAARSITVHRFKL